MYLDTPVKIPEVKGKIVLQRKPKATYVQLEIDREYFPELQYTNVKRVGIGKVADEEQQLMWANENYIKYFPDAELPETKENVKRSCGLRIGACTVIRKIINDYKLSEMLGTFLPAVMK